LRRKTKKKTRKKEKGEILKLKASAPFRSVLGERLTKTFSPKQMETGIELKVSKNTEYMVSLYLKWVFGSLANCLALCTH